MYQGEEPKPEAGLVISFPSPFGLEPSRAGLLRRGERNRKRGEPASSKQVVN